MMNLVIRAAVVAVVLLGAPAARADDLIYFEESGGGANPRGLYNLNSTTGTGMLRTTVGGSERFFSLTRQPGTGTYFAANVPGNTTLYTINVDTGVPTLVGATGVDTVADISFHPTTGKLYGLQRNSPYGFYEINPATAGVTFLGNLNDAVRCGLVFSNTGQLYGFTTTGILSQINLTTLAITPVGGTAGSFLVEDAAFTAAGNLFFTTFTGEVYQVNPANGSRTLVHSTGMGSGLLGIVEAPAACYPDCNGDGLLNLADFGCFQTKFATGNPYADCNGDTLLNLADFGCFQTKFAIGCP